MASRRGGGRSRPVLGPNGDAAFSRYLYMSSPRRRGSGEAEERGLRKEKDPPPMKNGAGRRRLQCESRLHPVEQVADGADVSREDFFLRRLPVKRADRRAQPFSNRVHVAAREHGQLFYQSDQCGEPRLVVDRRRFVGKERRVSVEKFTHLPLVPAHLGRKRASIVAPVFSGKRFGERGGFGAACALLRRTARFVFHVILPLRFPHRADCVLGRQE